MTPEFKVGDFIKCNCGAGNCPMGKIEFIFRKYYRLTGGGEILIKYAAKPTKLELVLK